MQFDAACKCRRDRCALDEQPSRLASEIKLTFFVVNDHSGSGDNVDSHDLGARCSDDKRIHALIRLLAARRVAVTTPSSSKAHAFSDVRCAPERDRVYAWLVRRIGEHEAPIVVKRDRAKTTPVEANGDVGTHGQVASLDRMTVYVDYLGRSVHALRVSKQIIDWETHEKMRTTWIFSYESTTTNLLSVAGGRALPLLDVDAASCN